MFSKSKIEESMDSELHIVVLVSSTWVALDLGFKSIVIFHSIIVDMFTLKIVRLNPPQVFYLKTVSFIGFPRSSYCCLLYISTLSNMIA